MTKTAEERDALLASLGLSPAAPAKPEPKVETPVQNDTNPHTMPVTDIVFDEHDIAGFDLETQFADASRALFAKYRGEGRNKDRNSLLHRRITEFLGKTRKARREPDGGFVKDKINYERELAKILRESGLTIEEVAAMYEATK